MQKQGLNDVALPFSPDREQLCFDDKPSTLVPLPNAAAQAGVFQTIVVSAKDATEVLEAPVVPIQRTLSSPPHLLRFSIGQDPNRVACPMQIQEVTHSGQANFKTRPI